MKFLKLGLGLVHLLFAGNGVCIWHSYAAYRVPGCYKGSFKSFTSNFYIVLCKFVL